MLLPPSTGGEDCSSGGAAGGRGAVGAGGSASGGCALDGGSALDGGVLQGVIHASVKGKSAVTRWQVVQVRRAWLTQEAVAVLLQGPNNRLHAPHVP